MSFLYCENDIDTFWITGERWVNYVAMLLVVCQLSRDVIGCEDS